MPEGRDYRIFMSIEPSFKVLIERLCKDRGFSTSTYLRKLVIQDLSARGLLTLELMTRIATTDSNADLESQVEAAIKAAS